MLKHKVSLQKPDRKKPPIVEHPEFAALGKAEVAEAVSEQVEVIGEITAPISEPVMTMILDAITDNGTTTAIEDPEWTFYICNNEPALPKLKIRKDGVALVSRVSLAEDTSYLIGFDDSMERCGLVPSPKGKKPRAVSKTSFKIEIPQADFKELQLRQMAIPATYQLNPETLIGELVAIPR